MTLVNGLAWETEWLDTHTVADKQNQQIWCLGNQANFDILFSICCQLCSESCSDSWNTSPKIFHRAVGNGQIFGLNEWVSRCNLGWITKSLKFRVFCLDTFGQFLSGFTLRYQPFQKTVRTPRSSFSKAFESSWYCLWCKVGIIKSWMRPPSDIFNMCADKYSFWTVFFTEHIWMRFLGHNFFPQTLTNLARRGNNLDLKLLTSSA